MSLFLSGLFAAVSGDSVSSMFKLVFSFAKFIGGVGLAAVAAVGVSVAWKKLAAKRATGLLSGQSKVENRAIAVIASAAVHFLLLWSKIPLIRRLQSRQPKAAIRNGISVIAIAAVYLLPMWSGLPLIKTTDVDFLTLLCASVVPFVLIALGLNVVVGMAGLLDLGYVGFYATGAYTVGILTSKHATWPWLLAFPLGVVVSLLIGVLLGAPTLRLRGDYLAIVTLGFGEIIRLSAQNFDFLGASEGISAIKRPPSAGFEPYSESLNKWYWVIGLTLILIVLFFLARLENSRVGRAWTAIREDEDAAELMGVPTFKYKLWAFAIGAAIGGLSGAFYAGQLTTIYPTGFDINKSILFLAAVVMGGLGNKWGAVLGGFAVAYLPERFRFIEDKRFVVFGLVLILMMIFRPQGLLPRKAGGKPADRDAGNRALKKLSEQLPGAQLLKNSTGAK
jgi:branched-chain amino acid transport system permease protein